ncbi:alpha-D-ribose 1-methylphosphonate 5-triphosphate diphosphatase [Mesobacterium sp. TK19101]|uniref:Alpha-D-ribose 1-methylphosphonate 5-triphosphate diphosphatase n=1 Tax=Mesobacterium hydrothermale TaxID=3111907 RepID=A0ABU6HBQ0_9RHOB|nr:alpha-D-ribose 1-methylphosphonate 5-triphosphate diphosphatase [Mesobacterium sp. TK19101]MEC3859875.1 alpha-D-ribose 1-methylphosphonate 5-triphosphate diphosphatase [Mesobacterium sp. TK19101]
MTDLTLSGAQVLLPEGLADTRLCLADSVIADAPAGREIDLRGFLILPGLVDIHGDGFERHMAPRRGALKEARNGMLATEAELAANGITTAVLAQFFSWEGGMRGPDFAEHVFEIVTDISRQVDTDLRLQLRLETHLLENFDRALRAIDRFGIRYVVFNDHLQHDRLATGRRPKRLTGQALKSGRSPEDHFAYMIALHQKGVAVPAALDKLCAQLLARGITLGSHDDHDAATRTDWAGRGVMVSEFPETTEAAQAAKDSGAPVILGAPNVMRGGSHAGNVSARDLVAMGLCDALASDYHYPALRHAAWQLAEAGLCDLPTAWAMVSETPARILGLTDRGRIVPGLRADLVVLEQATGRVGATFAGGRLTYLSGEAGRRFLL